MDVTARPSTRSRKAREATRGRGDVRPRRPRYDLVNRVMTLGLDRRWRRRTVASLGLPAGDRVLDLGCGTGDLCEELRTAIYQPVGVDMSAGMLGAAHTRAPLVRGTRCASRFPTARSTASCRGSRCATLSTSITVHECARVLCPRRTHRPARDRRAHQPDAPRRAPVLVPASNKTQRSSRCTTHRYSPEPEPVAGVEDRVGGFVGLEQGDAPAGGRARAADSPKQLPEVDHVAQREPGDDAVDRVSGTGSRSASPRTRGADVCEAASMPADTSKPTGVDRSAKLVAQVTGAAREVEHEAPAGSPSDATVRRRQRRSRPSEMTRLTRS